MLAALPQRRQTNQPVSLPDHESMAGLVTGSKLKKERSESSPKGRRFNS